MTNKIHDNVESPIQRLAGLLSQEQTESLTSDQQGKVLSLINEISANISLPSNELQAVQDLKNKIFTQTALFDIKKIFILFLRHSSDELISSAFGLETLQANSDINKAHACQEIISCFKNQSESLSLTNMGLISLPISIFHYLDHLKELYCSDNQLSSLSNLPEKLTKLVCSDNQLSSLPNLPEKLTKLVCSDNQLSSLPNLPETLKELYCSCNQLNSLPSLPATLTKLACSDNHLSSLPSLPATLKELDCFNNHLSSLPSLPEALTWLDCEENYLTPQSANLPARFELGSQKEADPSDVLQVFKIKAHDPSLQHFDENMFSDQPDLQANILTWLSKLTGSDEFKHETYGPVFATKILCILQCAQDNPGYCKTLQASLLEALSNCVDRASLPVNYLEVQKRIIDSKDDSLKNVLEILKGSFALNKLEQLSRAFMQFHPNVDEIEVYLGFQVKLKDALNLPIDLHNMNYFACSTITQNDLDQAETTVKEALKNAQDVTDYLISDKTWTDRLKKEFRVELEEILQSVFDDLEKLSEQTTLTSDQFKKENDALQVAQAKLEKEWILKKTQTLLTADLGQKI